jgi:hypothetical protein
VTGWELAWLLWIAAFAVIEGIALTNRTTGDTLSESVWRYLMPARGEWAWRLRRFMLLAFLAWICAHFLTRGAF